MLLRGNVGNKSARENQYTHGVMAPSLERLRLLAIVDLVLGCSKGHRLFSVDGLVFLEVLVSGFLELIDVFLYKNVSQSHFQGANRQVITFFSVSRKFFHSFAMRGAISLIVICAKSPEACRSLLKAAYGVTGCLTRRSSCSRLYCFFEPAAFAFLLSCRRALLASLI